MCTAISNVFKEHGHAIPNNMETNDAKGYNRKKLYTHNMKNLMTTAWSLYPSRRSRNEFRTILVGWIKMPRLFFRKTTIKEKSTKITYTKSKSKDGKNWSKQFFKEHQGMQPVYNIYKSRELNQTLMLMNHYFNTTHLNVTILTICIYAKKKNEFTYIISLWCYYTSKHAFNPIQDKVSAWYWKGKGKWDN